jgi:hypothetical protein
MFLLDLERILLSGRLRSGTSTKKLVLCIFRSDIRALDDVAFARLNPGQSLCRLWSAERLSGGRASVGFGRQKDCLRVGMGRRWINLKEGVQGSSELG